LQQGFLQAQAASYKPQAAGLHTETECCDVLSELSPKLEKNITLSLLLEARGLRLAAYTL
jgi:hypothetical protein